MTGEAIDAGPRRGPAVPGDQGRRAQPLPGDWVRGFEVAEVKGEGYRIRRLSDGTTLDDLFPRDDVRRERKRQGFWWH